MFFVQCYIDNFVTYYNENYDLLDTYSERMLYLSRIIVFRENENIATVLTCFRLLIALF